MNCWFTQDYWSKAKLRGSSQSQQRTHFTMPFLWGCATDFTKLRRKKIRKVVASTATGRSFQHEAKEQSSPLTQVCVFTGGYVVKIHRFQKLQPLYGNWILPSHAMHFTVYVILHVQKHTFSLYIVILSTWTLQNMIWLHRHSETPLVKLFRNYNTFLWY